MERLNDVSKQGVPLSSQRRKFMQSTFALGLSAGSVPLLLSMPARAGERSSGESSSASQGSDFPMQAAIKACLDCHSACLRMAMTYCIEKGGRHADATHLRLLMNCAELCQTSANFMLSGSSLHGRVCGVCAEVCEACARSCEQVGDMSECVEQCRRCAKSCKTMA